MNIQEQEAREFHYSSPAEWDREEARWIGMENPDRAWIATGNDVWHKNPYYKGPPVPHPEDDGSLYDEDFIGPHQPYKSDDEIPF